MGVEETGSIDERWTLLKDNILILAADTLGKRKTEIRTYWITDNITEKTDIR